MYHYAREYFGLPEPSGGVFLEDARGWIDKRAITVNDGKYLEPGNATQISRGAKITSRELFDFVIHDCFSGGSVPMLLFSAGFFRSIKKMLKEDGVLAVVRLESNLGTK